MTQEDLFKLLHELGLSRRESDIYLFLSHNGMQQAASVSGYLKIDRVQTYRALKSLQDKGIVEATLESPTRFAAISLDVLLDSLVKAKKSEATMLEKRKEELVAYWRSRGESAMESTIPRFRVLLNQKRIHEEIVKAMEEATEEALELTSNIGLIMQDTAGVLDSIESLIRKKPKLKIMMLADVSKQNLEIVEHIARILSRNSNVQFRHINMGSRTFPEFVIRDGKEAILYVTRDKSSPANQTDTGLLIQSDMFVTTLREYFMDIWNSAVPVEQRIEELKTGKPIEETFVIKDPTSAQSRLLDTLKATREDVMAILSSAALNGLLKDNVFDLPSKKPVKVRIMAPIDLDNLEAARKISEASEVRSVPISFLSMLIIDHAYLFIFSTPSAKSIVEPVFPFENMFYSNDLRYVGRVNDMLNDMWKRGTDIKDIISGKGIKASEVRVSEEDLAPKVIEKMLSKGSESVVVIDRQGTPLGIITYKDVLERMVKPRRDPEKTRAKELMSMPILQADANKPLIETLRKIRKTGINKIAVFKEGKLAGMFRLD